jgi:ABC-type Fe3+ transport system permease subunit
VLLPSCVYRPPCAIKIRRLYSLLSILVLGIYILQAGYRKLAAAKEASMEYCTATTVMSFSRQMRRRAAQSERGGRGPQGPSPGRPRSGGYCCLVVLLILVAIVVLAYLQAYVFTPPPPQPERKRSSLVEKTIIAQQIQLSPVIHALFMSTCLKNSAKLSRFMESFT